MAHVKGGGRKERVWFLIWASIFPATLACVVGPIRGTPSKETPCISAGCQPEKNHSAGQLCLMLPLFLLSLPARLLRPGKAIGWVTRAKEFAECVGLDSSCPLPIAFLCCRTDDRIHPRPSSQHKISSEALHRVELHVSFSPHGVKLVFSGLVAVGSW